MDNLDKHMLSTKNLQAQFQNPNQMHKASKSTLNAYLQNLPAFLGVC